MAEYYGGPPPIPSRAEWRQGGNPPPLSIPRGGVEIKSLTVPALTVCAFALFLISVTYMAAIEMAAIKYSIKEVSTKLDANTAGTDGKITRIERELVSRTASRWTRKDQDYFIERFCIRAEQMNKGWRCPATSSVIKEGEGIVSEFWPNTFIEGSDK